MLFVKPQPMVNIPTALTPYLMQGAKKILFYISFIYL